MLLLAKPPSRFLLEAAAATLSDLCGHPEGRTCAPVFQALAGIEGAAGRWRGIEPMKQCQSQRSGSTWKTVRHNSLFIPPRERSIGHRKAVRANLSEPDDRHEAVSSPVQTFRGKRQEGMRRDRKQGSRLAQEDGNRSPALAPSALRRIRASTAAICASIPPLSGERGGRQ